MKIKCIENNNSALPVEFLANYSISYEKFPLTIDKEYFVYGLGETDGNIWYCIYDDLCSYYPMWIPFPFFEIIDDRLSRYWVFSFDEEKGKKCPFLGFPEWANQLDFYDNLTDGKEQEVQIFKSYKELMDLEFPNSSISEVAQIGDDEWLICPTCIDLWQHHEERDALVRCPKCLKTFNNPRYKNEYPHIDLRNKP
jgi:hypothetical protein